MAVLVVNPTNTGYWFNASSRFDATDVQFGTSKNVSVGFVSFAASALTDGTLTGAVVSSATMVFKPQNLSGVTCNVYASTAYPTTSTAPVARDAVALGTATDTGPTDQNIACTAKVQAWINAAVGYGFQCDGGSGVGSFKGTTTPVSYLTITYSTNVLIAGAMATETDDAFAGAPAVTLPGTMATELDEAFAGTATYGVAGSMALETDDAFAGAPAVTLPGTMATEVDDAFDGSIAVTLPGAMATEVDVAFAGSIAVTVEGSTAVEVDVAFHGRATGGQQPAPPAVPAPPRYLWALLTPAGGRELTQARARSLKFFRRGPASATFSIDGEHEEAAEIEELVTDVVVRRGGEKIFRGRVGPTGDELEETYELKVSAGDYRAILDRRFLREGDPVGFGFFDAGFAVSSILDTIQSRPAGDLGITIGSGVPVGEAADVNFVPGQSAMKVLDQMQDAGLFDYEIDPDLVLNLFPGGRVFESGEVLEYRANVRKVSRTVDPGTYANAGRFTGADGVPAVNADAAGIASRPEGRWEAQVGRPDVQDYSLLLRTANAELNRLQTVLPGYVVTLKDGWWQGPDHLWVGSIAELRVRRGRLDVHDDLIVEALEISLDDDGNETVVLSLGWSFPGFARRLTDAEHRLRDLERI